MQEELSAPHMRVSGRRLRCDTDVSDVTSKRVIEVPMNRT